jgi:hypothetical protein
LQKSNDVPSSKQLAEKFANHLPQRVVVVVKFHPFMLLMLEHIVLVVQPSSKLVDGIKVDVI